MIRKMNQKDEQRIIDLFLQLEFEDQIYTNKNLSFDEIAKNNSKLTINQNLER